MAKNLVRQFKTQAAPAAPQGYAPQAVAQAEGLRAEYPNYGVPAKLPPGPPLVQDTILASPHPVIDLSTFKDILPYIPPLTGPRETAQPRRMGTPAPKPDWYPETPNRIWSPGATTGGNIGAVGDHIRISTGAEDVPTITTTNTPIGGTGFFPDGSPEVVENIGRPNVGVDITPEQYTLPPQERVLQERPYDPLGEPPVDYSPITTPIARPYQEEAGNIELQQPIDLTPGPQVTGTYDWGEPQPIESAYADPIQVDYPQTQTQPIDIPQDDITNLIDNVLPEVETLGAKTIDIFPAGDQVTIDQTGFTQTDPSLINMGMPTTIEEAPEIALTGQTQQEVPYVIDYSDTYGQPVPQQELPQVFTPEPIIGEPEITLRPEIGMPEIPVTATTDDGSISIDGIEAGLGTTEEIALPTSESIGITPETMQPPVGANVVEATVTSGPEIEAEAFTPTTTTGGVSAEDDFFGEDYHLETAQEAPRAGIDFAIPGQGVTAPVVDLTTADTAGTTETVIPAKTITPEGEVIDEGGKTYTVDTEAEPDITQLSDAAITGEPIEGPLIEQAVEDPGTFVPTGVPPPPEVIEDTGGTVTQPTTPGAGTEVQQGALTAPGPGGWLYTGPQGYAQTRWSTSGAAQGPPVVSQTPAVTGPQVNRETGEITEAPLSWWSNRAGYDFMQPGAPLPTGKPGGSTVPGAPPSPENGETEVGEWRPTDPPEPVGTGLQHNNWTSGVTSTANAQSFLDEATRAGVPVVEVDSFGNPQINLSSSTWSTASDAGVDTQSLSKYNFKDADGNTRNAFEVGVNFVGKGIKGAYNLVFGNSSDQSAKDLASNLGEKETASFGEKAKALWKEYAMPFETDNKDPNNLVNPLTGEVQKKGDMQYGFMYNVVTGNIPALAGQMGLHIGHKIFEGLSQGLKRVFSSDVLQGVTSGVMDTLKFAGNKMGQFLGLDTFNKKVESKDFETQEMQDWEQTYGEETKGKEGEGEKELTWPQLISIFDDVSTFGAIRWITDEEREGEEPGVGK